jgi:hypothetical protein
VAQKVRHDPGRRRKNIWRAQPEALLPDEGAQVAPRAKMYFGDLTIDWKNTQASSRQSSGPIGWILDQSYNDGIATISVAGGRDEVLARYAAFMEKDGHLR